MDPAPPRIVADLGNSRLKLARLGPGGGLDRARTLPLDAAQPWAAADIPRSAAWAVSTVNPPAADRLARAIGAAEPVSVRWFRSAADVPVPHRLDAPEATGADRALAVLAASAIAPPGVPGLVVSCGTAITVDRVGPDGTWQGGAIAPGLGPAAEALHLRTAQLPRVEVGAEPPAWGRSTAPAITAGLFWGLVGAIRELVARQSEGMPAGRWLVWTGGDADRFAPRVDPSGPRIVPELVLLGLARAAFGEAD